MTEKDKFIKYFKQQGFINMSTEYNNICFVSDRIRIELEDSNWNNISFDIFIEDAYITCITSLKELKQLFKVLNW
jgi:hypothetical protein